MMKFPEIQDFQYVPDFQHWSASIQNEWIDLIIPSKYAEILPQQQFDFLKCAEPLMAELLKYGQHYIQQLSALNLQKGGLNSIRYNHFNQIAYVELCYVFEQDPDYAWSVGFQKNPRNGFLLDVSCASLDYGYSAVILHREPV